MDKRTRTRKVSGLPGFVISNSGPGAGDVIGVLTPTLEDWRCEDYWHKKVRKDGSLPPSQVYMTKHFRFPYYATRNSGIVKLKDYCVHQGTTSEAGFDNVRPPRGSLARVNQNRELALQLLAATNPFRTEYSVPVAIKELLDVSSLFKLTAKTFASMIGGMYLNYKFGWVQFVRDIETLVDITKCIERRVKEFDSLARKGGLRRKVTLMQKSSDYWNPNVQLMSTWSHIVRANIEGRYSCETVGTVRWRLKDGVISRLDKLSAFNLAVDRVFGLGDLNPQTIWNMIPFSWLVDYFVDMNSYFGSFIGDNIVEPYDICIGRICRSRFKQHITRWPSNSIRSGLGQYGRDTYDRDLVATVDFPIPTLSLLTKDRIITLAALLASFKRR